MGLFALGSKKTVRTAAAAAAEAWQAGVGAALPGAQVSVEAAEGQPYGKFTVSNRYTVQLAGTRSEFPAVAGRLAAAFDALARDDILYLQIAESAAPGAAASSLFISGRNREQEWVHFLVRSHDALVARIPGESVVIDGVYGRHAVMAVARGNAVSTARLLMTWWAELLATGLERWPLTGLGLGIGGDRDGPEITYTIDLPGPGLEAEPAPVPAPEQRRQAASAVAAWTGALDDLDALTRLPLPDGCVAEVGFRLPDTAPQLTLWHDGAGVWKKEEAAELAAAIRLANPASRIRPA